MQMVRVAKNILSRTLRPGFVLLVAIPLTVAVLSAQAPKPAPKAPGPKEALTGTMQQVMRGIFFPNANIIFNVQSNDPGEKKPVPANAPGGSNFNWITWGSSLYSGWEDVEYAAVTLAEVSPVLLTPGRTCENGKPVPVERADWIMYTDGMLEAAKKSFAAAKMRNQEAVSDSTNDLNDACQNCHRVFRRGGAPGSGDSSNMGLRCVAP